MSSVIADKPDIREDTPTFISPHFFHGDREEDSEDKAVKSW